METITNVASTAATTVSNLIYGQPPKDNETKGNEPVSGEQGKGTAAEPFDKGNSEDPTTSTKTTTSDDFLKLNPAVGKSAPTDSAADVKTGTSHEASMPIVPLNPDAANLGSPSTSTATGVTDKAGVADTVWKPTPLDEVKPSGAPGAGPEPPAHVTPATPADLDGTATSKETTTDTTPKDDSTKHTETTKESHGSAQAQTSHVSPEVDAVIKGEHPKVEHSVPETEAESPEAKMEDKTKRNTNMESKPDTTGEAPVVPSSDKKTTESKPETKSDTKSPERSSSGNGPEEKDSKMANLKDKLKTKLHIGSKDK